MKPFIYKHRRIFRQLSIFLIVALIVTAYSLISLCWRRTQPSPILFLFEVPILAMLVSAVTFRVKSDKTLFKILSYTPFVSVVVFYIYFDLFFLMLARSPRFSDFQDLSALFKLWDPTLVIVAALPLLVLFVAILVNLFYYIKRLSPKQYLPRLAIRLAVLLAISSFIVQGEYMAKYIARNLKFTNWAQEHCGQENGRFTAMCYYQSCRQKELKLLKTRTYAYDVLCDERCELKTHHNVHIVLMESFFDPRLFTNVRFNKEPIAPNLKKYLFDGQFSLTRSPVYGGGTAQAEFEVLCGAPALAKIDSIEFNCLRGFPAYSICKPLEENGYNTTCSCSTEPGIFNSDRAYPSLRFQKIIYKNNGTPYLNSPKDDKSPFFDGYLFKQNIEFVRRKLAEKKPFLNYLLGIYGHSPHVRDKAKRPDVIFPKYTDRTDEVSTKFFNACNQFYYRTKELGLYLDKLTAVDKDSIILVFGDHLPPINDGKVKYRNSTPKDWKTVPYILIKGGKVVDAKVEHQYQLHYEILKYLGCQLKSLDESPKTLTNRYYSILALANNLRKTVGLPQKGKTNDK